MSRRYSTRLAAATANQATPINTVEKSKSITPSKNLPSGRKKRFRHEMDPLKRRARLETDEWATDITPQSLLCLGCKQRKKLDGRGGAKYYTGFWEKHKKRCKGIPKEETTSSRPSYEQDEAVTAVKGKFFDGKKRRVERPSLKQVPSKATGEGAEPEETENSCMKEELVDFPREGISSSLGSLSILECERRSRDSVPLPTGNEPLISILKSPPPGSVLPGCSLGSSADFEGVPDMQGTEGESCARGEHQEATVSSIATHDRAVEQKEHPEVCITGLLELSQGCEGLYQKEKQVVSLLAFLRRKEQRERANL